MELPADSVHPPSDKSFLYEAPYNWFNPTLFLFLHTQTVPIITQWHHPSSDVKGVCVFIFIHPYPHDMFLIVFNSLNTPPVPASRSQQVCPQDWGAKPVIKQFLDLLPYICEYVWWQINRGHYGPLLRKGDPSSPLTFAQFPGFLWAHGCVILAYNYSKTWNKKSLILLWHNPSWHLMSQPTQP